ncbi:MAG: redoxin domain-containing protein [Bacteroidales bacterium]|nr:redoxin domain-containing protein [Bacteroidales bacterium]
MKTTRFEIIIALIISVLLCNSCKNDNGFTINGKISNCTNCNIVLEKLSPMKIDTVASANSGFNGNFTIGYNDSIRHLYRLRINNATPIHICAVNGESISLSADINNITGYSISGTIDCEELKRLNVRMIESTQKVEELRSKVSQQFGIDKASLEKSNRIADSLYQSDKRFIADFIKKNHESPIIYFALHQYVSTTPIMQLPADYETYQYVLDEMKAHNPELEETRYLESEIKRFELQQEQQNRRYVNLTEGSPAPDFSLLDENGEKFCLADFKGKEITLCFWASWDKKSIKEVQNYLAQNNDRSIILISLDTSRDQWLQAIKFHKLGNATNLCDFKSWESINAKLYGIKTVPTFVEISGEGRIEKIQ